MQTANWITKEGCNVFQNEFFCGKDVVSAQLYITAKGVYEAQLNGQRVGDFVLAPGFTSYKKRHQYQQYDVTPMLKGKNALTVSVGDGWYLGRLAWDNNSHIYGDTKAILAKLVITYGDKTEVIVTDKDWRCGSGPIVMDSIYDGERYDANITPDFTQIPDVLDAPKDHLIPQQGEQVKEQETLAPVAIFTTPKGERVVDFGQNLTGYVAFSLTAKKGERICISHAEVLDAQGNFYTENLRSAKAQIEYICKDGFQEYKPHFTFFGFRYIRLDQCPGEIDLRAIVVHSDLKRTGHFDCSHPMINQLYQNTIWGQKGNFLDIPTDCPQRDERLGWTGDAQAFIKAASYHFDVNRFFEKWLADLRADQLPNGSVPHVIPDVLFDAGGSAAWGDATTICPWQLYLTYHNTRVLEDQFDSMKRWVDFSDAPGRNHFGDWLGLDAAPGTNRGSTNEELIRTAFNAHSTQILIKAGHILGKDVAQYEVKYDQIVADFRRNYTLKTQTEHVLALMFHLVEDEARVAADLAELIVKDGSKLQTGFVGTPYLLHVLSDHGYAELAYTLLLRQEYPSWLYPITKGATTIWEHWDGIGEDGSFWSNSMNSFNHYAYGAVADWLYECAAGIGVDENAPGFAHILLKPVVDERLSYVTASLETAHGRVSSRWEIQGDWVRYEFEVPTTATIYIGSEEHHVQKGVYQFEQKRG